LCYIFLFPWLEGALTDHCYADTEATYIALTVQLCSILENAFQGCLNDHQKCRKQCVIAEAEYFKHNTQK
jgi:hypothetical protein